MNIRAKSFRLAALALIALGASSGFAQITWDNDGADGLWGTAANWSGNAIPGAADDVLLDNTTVAGSYTVTMDNTARNCRTIAVGYAGNANTITLQIPATNTQPAALTVAGTAGDDIVADEGGRIEHLSGSASGTVIVNTAAGNTARFKNGSYYFHNSTRGFNGPFPATGNGATTFDNGSTVEFGQIASTTLMASGRTFCNLTLSATAPKTYSATGAGGTTINGTLTVGTNAALSLSMTGVAAVFNGNIVLNGNACTVSDTAGISFPSTTSLSGAANLTLGDGTAQAVTVGGSLTNAGSGALNLAANEVLTVNNGATLQCSSTAIGGTGTVTVASGGTLGIRHAGGINGQIAGGGTFNTGGNYSYNGSSGQVTGASLPASVNNLTIDNAAGVTLSAGCTVNGTLTLTAGELATGGNILTAQDGSGVVRTAGFVTGAGYQRAFNAATLGARVFDVGTSGAYTPVMINVTAGGTGTGTIAIASTAADHPNVTNAALTLNRFWTISALGLGVNPTMTLTFQYLSGDVTGGTEASYIALRHISGANYQEFGASTTINTGGDFATVTGVTGFSDWTLGESAGVPVELSGFAIE